MINLNELFTTKKAKARIMQEIQDHILYSIEDSGLDIDVKDVINMTELNKTLREDVKFQDTLKDAAGDVIMEHLMDSFVVSKDMKADLNKLVLEIYEKNKAKYAKRLLEKKLEI